MDTTIVVIILAGLVTWLGLLTAALLRWRREHGAPVYRRLPNGRLRFEWTVHTAYQAARRDAVPHAGPGSVDAPRSDRARASHHDTTRWW